MVGEGVVNLDVGVGDFELVDYGDCRIYVATSGEDHTESVSGIILRGGYLLIWLLVFEGETAEELEGPEIEKQNRERSVNSVCVCVCVCQRERERCRACLDLGLSGRVREKEEGREE